MRKPRDPSTSLRGAYDSELKALSEKARLLKARKVQQLGELVIACGADVLTPEQLAGALLAAVDADAADKEVWRKHGAAFFHRNTRARANRTHPIASSASSDHGGAAST
jgi:DNA-binding protein H-NS